MLIGNKAFWIGAVGSAVFLAVFVLLFVDMDTIGNVLNDADYAYVMPSLLFYFLAVWFRTARWKFLLRPLIGKPQKSIYSVVIVGYMANNLIPIRIGIRLLSSENIDKTATKRIKFIGLLNMPVKGRSIKLSQNVDSVES